MISLAIFLVGFLAGLFFSAWVRSPAHDSEDV